MIDNNVIALVGILSGIAGTFIGALFSFLSKKMELKHQSKSLILSEKNEIYSKLVSNLTSLPQGINYPNNVLLDIIFLANKASLYIGKKERKNLLNFIQAATDYFNILLLNEQEAYENKVLTNSDIEKNIFEKEIRNVILSLGKDLSNYP